MLEAIDMILIQQLLARYGHALDTADWDGLAALFTDDAVIDYTSARAEAVHTGTDEIVGYFRAANHPAAHHVTNIVIDVEADPAGRVEVTSKFIAPFTRARNVPIRFFGGDYRDEVVKTPDGWKFAAKTCRGRWQYTPDPDDDTPEYRRTY
jgi:3-phenylpropionate/cinnamic acid dioxygenase small subunit